MPSTDTKLRFPAEWETQSGVLLTWPHVHSDWQPMLHEIEPVYASICKSISDVEICVVICFDDAHREYVRKQLRDNDVSLEYCKLIVCKTNDTWCRDYAAITTLVDGKPVMNNFIFDSWGGKYEATLDNAVSNNLNQQGLFNTASFIDRKFVLEGGSIESDGLGTLLTTSHCLLKRHPDKSKQELAAYLATTLGASHMLWLDHGGLGGDDTDSHIDNLARFVDTNTIVYAACKDKTHPDYVSLKKMESQLLAFRKEDGTKYKSVPIYVPEPIYHDSQMLPASYVNFLVINKTVLVPVFGQQHDQDALTVFQEYFPNHQIIGINSNALIKQYGGIHCATMQFPAGILNEDF